MKIRLLKDAEGRQAMLVRLNEREDGEAFMEFHESDSGHQTAQKLRELADTIEQEATKVG